MSDATMGIKLPVYSDQYGYHQINVWTQAANGMFHRTSQWLMPHLLINFKDLSESLGEVVSPNYDRRHHDWHTATAYNYMGRPSSLFNFLRTEAKNRRIMVLTTATNSGRAYRFTVNELRFKSNVSTAVKALTCRSFMDVIEVFMSQERKGAPPDPGIDVSHDTGAEMTDAFQQAVLSQWRPLAERGDANAQYTLGYLYEKGRGVEQDYREAVRWYRMAAQNSHLPAQAHLGSLYASGKGTPQNDVLACFWFGLVASTGNEAAKRLRRKFTERMTPAQMAAARHLVKEWKEGHRATAGGPTRH